MTDILKEQLLAELSSRCLPWEKKAGGDDEEACLHWLPVADLSGGRLRLGLLQQGLWARATESFARPVSDSESCVFCLPLLEETPEAVHEKIIEGLESHGLSSELMATFPFGPVISAGLESQSEHWSGLALKGVSSMPRPDDFRVALEALSQSGETQKIRHGARKILKRQAGFRG